MYLKKRHINLKGEGGGAYKYYATIVTQDADWLYALIAEKKCKSILGISGIRTHFIKNRSIQVPVYMYNYFTALLTWPFSTQIVFHVIYTETCEIMVNKIWTLNFSSFYENV